MSFRAGGCPPPLQRFKSEKDQKRLKKIIWRREGAGRRRFVFFPNLQFLNTTTYFLSTLRPSSFLPFCHYLSSLIFFSFFTSTCTRQPPNTTIVTHIFYHGPNHKTCDIFRCILKVHCKLYSAPCFTCLTFLQHYFLHCSTTYTTHNTYTEHYFIFTTTTLH